MTPSKLWGHRLFSRGLFGLPRDPSHIGKVLKDLSLWEERFQLMALSGAMKRRGLIAKALAHEPRILFLDEPTADVGVELCRACGPWCGYCGVTIILTTHYIEEAEADIMHGLFPGKPLREASTDAGQWRTLRPKGKVDPHQVCEAR